MKRLSNPLRMIFALLVIALLAACAPGEEPPSPEEIEAAISTAVAQTMEAEEQIAASVEMTVAAREAEAAKALEALSTATLVPTQPLPTLTPILPTATPFTVASSSGGGGGGGGGGTTTYEYSCAWVDISPRYDTEYKREHTFDIKFTIVNNGTATWQAGKDLVLLPNANVSGTLLAPPAAPIQLPKMEPGDTFAIGPFDAQAPDEPGHYVIDFKLEGGFCYPFVSFYVVR